MKITEIRRLMSFGQRENMSMTARVDECEDPHDALRALESVMREGIARYEEAIVRRCRICGCTEEHGCEYGCYWVEPDLCSACAVSDEFMETHAREMASSVVQAVGGLEPGSRELLVDLVAEAIIDAYRKGRRAAA